MKKTPRPTIRDVAQAAGASIATVSRVLNNTDYPVSDDKRAQILEAVKALDYMPNGLSKALKNGRSHEIGVVVPSLLNPYYAEVVSGIEKACYERGYTPVFCSSNNEPKKEQQHLDFFLKMRMDGLIVSTLGLDSTLVERAVQSCVPTVLFDQPAESDACDSVTYNFFDAGKMAANYLLSKGHRKIAFFALPFDRQSRIDRYEGFCQALKEAKVPFQKNRLFLINTDISESGTLTEFSGGGQLVGEFLKKSDATAVVAINDLIALGAMNEFSKNGMRIPQDMSIISFDDIAFAAMSNPPLTTIKQPSFEMGRLAAYALINKIEQSAAGHNAVVMQPQLQERESVCSIK